MARTYRRDARGRFASGGGSGAKGGGGKGKPAAKAKPAAKPKTTSKPAASAGKGKPKPTTSKPTPAAKGTRKPATSKPKATGKPKKPPLPPPIPEALLKAARVTSAAMRERRRTSGIANNIRPSPRRHTPEEAAYWELRYGKGRSKFRSDKKVREEMQRRGFLKGSTDPVRDMQLIGIRARKKKGTWPGRR